MPMPAGYKTITPIQLTNTVWALNQCSIGAHEFRVYLACFELTAIREAARRSRHKQGTKPKDLARYRLVELERLTALSGEEVRRALRRLQAAGLVQFAEEELSIARDALSGSEDLLNELACRRSPKRPIPVPRRLLRFLSANRSMALTKTIVAYLLRGLSIARRTGDINAKGTVKASWIAKHLELSERAVKYAQAQLREMEWISKDTASRQTKLNRTGSYFVINLDWRNELKASSTDSAARPSIVNRDKPTPAIAPLLIETAPVFAPPVEDKETSNEDKNQEAHLGETLVHGIFQMQNQNSVATPPPPNLCNIQPEDLRRLDHLNALYEQATTRGWLVPSEAMALNFVAAAVRARAVGDRPGSLFVTLVKRQLWQHITQAQEDHARRALARYRDACPQGFHHEPPLSPKALAA